MVSLRSACHCGTVQLQFPRPDKPLTECECSLCFSYGALWAYYPEDQVEIIINRGSERQRDGTFATSDSTDQSAVDGERRGHGRELGTGPGVAEYLSGAKQIAYCHCEKCGNLTHWFPIEGAKYAGGMIGVNCRQMVDKDELKKMERKVTAGPP